MNSRLRRASCKAGSPRKAGRIAPLHGLAMLALAACGSAPRTTFDLARPADATHAARSLRAALAVAEPVATLPIDSDRIVVRAGPQDVSYLAGAQWADRLPRLVQARLIESFDRGALAGGAGRPGEGQEHALLTEIRRFEIDLGRQEAIVEIAARIVDERGGQARGDQARAGRVFEASAPAPLATGREAARALDDALEAVLAQIASWAARRA